MKSNNKTILFCRTTQGKQVHQYPVAAFNGPASAKSYATLLHLAYTTGNADMLRSLDAGFPITEEGKLAESPKWSLSEVPYEPTAELGSVTEEPAVAPATT